METGRIRSILYVDDDADICEIVLATLSLISGFQVRTAASGTQAIDMAYECRPDLILMDVMMPGLDGPSTLKKLRASPLVSSIPVIFLTAKVLPSEVTRYRQLGALGVIAKPFDPMSLGQQILSLWQEATFVCPASHGTPDEQLVTDQISELTGDFIARTGGDVLRLRNMMEQLQRGNRAALRSIEELAHTIHGAGAMFGFQALSQAGEAIERQAAQACAADQSGTAPDPALPGALREVIDRLAAEVDAVRFRLPDGIHGYGASDDRI